MSKEKLERIENYLEMQANAFQKASVFGAITVQSKQHFEAIAETYFDAADLIDDILEEHFEGEN